MGWGRPQIQGRARALSWAVATWVAWGDLVGAGEGLPGQCLAPEDPPPAFLHVQPAGALGMKACRMRGWPSSQARVLLLSWLDRLPVITQMVPSGLACSSSWRKSW